MSHFELVEPYRILFQGFSEDQVDFSFCPQDIKTMATSLSFLHFFLYQLVSSLSRIWLMFILIYTSELQLSTCLPSFSALLFAARYALSFSISLELAGIHRHVTMCSFVGDLWFFCKLDLSSSGFHIETVCAGLQCGIFVSHKIPLYKYF